MAEFAESATRAFARLVDVYGFAEPRVEDFGREVSVYFHKGSHTVSVSQEYGGRPIVEIFYPAAETGEPAIPWAERHGIPRARRIRPIGDDDLESLFAALERDESTFLWSEGDAEQALPADSGSR